MRKFDLFGIAGEEWRHIGTVEAPNSAAVRQVAWHYMERTGETRVRVFTCGEIGRMVADLSYSGTI